MPRSWSPSETGDREGLKQCQEQPLMLGVAFSTSGAWYLVMEGWPAKNKPQLQTWDAGQRPVGRGLGRNSIRATTWWRLGEVQVAWDQAKPFRNFHYVYVHT